MFTSILQAFADGLFYQGFSKARRTSASFIG